MSLHNFNPSNKSWKMYSNTLTSISGDNLTIKPYDGKNLLLEVSGNNNIFFKRGDISYGLDDLIGGGNSNITLTSVSGDIIPSNNNAFKLGDVSKNWKNAYIRDISLTNMSASGSIIPIVSELVRPVLPVNSGTVIALNSSGTIVATTIQFTSGSGRVRVYEFTNNTWIQLGQDVSMGTLEYTEFGYSIGLNGDGNILAVGAPSKTDTVNAFDSAGCVTVYKYTTTWNIFGQFYGETAYAGFGSNISLNYKGTVLAIGSKGDPPPNNPYGVVKVYKYNDISWIDIASINGLIYAGRNGESLSLNEDGTIIAISTSYINQNVWGANGPINGFVNVYQYISGSTWQPYGQQINGTEADEMFGYSISLNSNGTIVAIGSPLYDGSSVTINTGRVLVYKYSDITWQLLGNIFNGYVAGDFFGRSVSLNAAGNVLAIGVPYYDLGTVTVSNHSHGRVLLYNYNNGWGTPIIINGSQAKRGAGWFVALNRKGTVLGYCQYYDNNGQDAPIENPVTFYINQIANNEGGNIGKNETRWSTGYITNMYSDTIRPMNNGTGSLGAFDSVFDIAYLNTLSVSKIIATTVRSSNIIGTNRVYEINTTSMTWERHKAKAMSLGKTLASILNATENQQVIDLLVSNNISRAFIGGTRTNSNTTGQTSADWRWINGDNWSYTNFMPNQPDQQYERALEYYTASFGSITHQWNDVNTNSLNSAAVYMSIVDINLLTSKANIASPTFTGTVTISGDISNVRQIIPQVSNDISTSLGSATNIWNSAYINDITATQIIPKVVTVTIPQANTSTEYIGEDYYNRYYVYSDVGSGTFTPQSNRTVDILIVGGGGGGGVCLGGGGGGGGVIFLPNVTLTNGTTYNIIVGDGGASQTNGNSSSFDGAIAAGGGAGGGPYNSATSNGSAGGSGGGASGNEQNGVIYYGGATSGSTLGTYSGTIYGNRGGSLTAIRDDSPVRGAGGGGAGAAALDTDPNILDTYEGSEGSGGVGIMNDIYFGQNYYWGGGGGGAAYYNQGGGYGGYGGGGGGSVNYDDGREQGYGGGESLNYGGDGGIGGNLDGGAGGVNTGGGGGAGSFSAGQGGMGGSGIVIIREKLIQYSNNATIGTATNFLQKAFISDISVTNISVTNISISKNIVFPPSSIIGEDISNYTITTNKLANNSITNIKLQGNCVTTTNIADNTIIAQQLQGNCVITSKIADLNVTQEKLSTAVQTKLNLAGTIPANSINSSHIIDGSILGTDIAINQIGVNHLTGAAYLDLVTSQAENSINTGNIVNGSIIDDHIYPLTITGAKIADSTINFTKFDPITYDALNDLALRLAHLELTAITRSVDVVTGIQNTVTIPIDLLNNDSVEISATFRFYNTQNSGSRLYAYYNAAVDNSVRQFTGTTINIVTQEGTQNELYTSANLDWRAMLMYNMNTDNVYGNTNSLVFKMIRPVNDLADPKEWAYVGESTWSRGNGRARAELNGSYAYRPSTVSFYTNAGYNFQVRYSIINDTRT